MKWLLAWVAVALPVISAQPAFDAAFVEVHAAADAEGHNSGPWIQVSKGGVTVRNAKLSWCLGWAYDKTEWLISGPDWVFLDRYDVVAKSDGPATTAQLKLMMQTLLLDRFRLKLHQETRSESVTALAPANHAPKNLHPAADTGPPDGPRPVGIGKMVQSLAYKNVSMADFCERLGAAPPLGLGSRIVDATGIAGVFDITLNINLEKLQGAPDDFSVLVQLALDHQLGLKLSRRKMPVEILIIDSGNKIPTEN